MRADVVIRPECPQDVDQIDHLVQRSLADGTPYSDGSTEVQFVHEIRAGIYALPDMSFVATIGDEIVGHVMFSRLPLSVSFDVPATRDAEAEPVLAMMSPVAVHADRLRQGIGTAMLTQAIDLVRESGQFPGILVEGNPAYYRRFGFETSTDYDIRPGATCIFPQTHPECLMVMETTPGSLDAVSGYVNYEMYPAITDEIE